VWIIDPLDGTNEFGEVGRPDWAVHVALVVDGAPVAAAVALPAVGRTFVTDPPPTVPPPGERRPRIVTSRFRSPQAAVIAAQVLGADVVRLGSAGAKTMAVVMGHADVYAHHGGMYEWDSAAPAAVAAAAGLHVSRIDGSPLVYNNPDPWLPDLLVCRPELAQPILDALWS
jgi:3'(2'), 5'-bisphosphate nucleotidase